MSATHEQDCCTKKSCYKQASEANRGAVPDGGGGGERGTPLNLLWECTTESLRLWTDKTR